MTDYLFQEVPVYDRLGVNLMLARNVRIDVLDTTLDVVSPGLKQQGQPVPYVTTDQLGRATFTTTQGFVRLRSPKGLERIVYSPQYLQENLTAKDAAAASAASAASAATSAQNAANLVGAPAKSAMDAAMGGDVAGLVPAVAGKVTKGAQFLLLNEQPGVDPTGATDCTAAIQTAINLAASKGVPLIDSGGQYRLTSGITISNHVDLSRSIMRWSGLTGTAVTITACSRKRIHLGYIRNSDKTVAGWGQVAGTVGLKILNANSNTISVENVNQFETNILLRGDGVGQETTYNKITLGEVDNGKNNLRFEEVANQNHFIGGRFSHPNTEGSLVSGVRHIVMSNGTFRPNNNTFTNTGLESLGVCEYIIETYGVDCIFDNCRWENTGAAGTKKVWFRGTARNNLIRGGFEAANLTKVSDAGTYSNRIQLAAGNLQVLSTANAESAGLAGVGAVYYDSTLSRPMWSNGSAWRPAMPGPFAPSVTKSADYVLALTDRTVLCNGSAPMAVTLPAANTAEVGQVFTVKNITANAVTVNTAGGTIDGAATKTLAQWERATYMSSGTNWFIVA